MIDDIEKKPTANELILRALTESPVWISVHEFAIEGVSQNNIATRLSEFARKGKVRGRIRGGKRYKEWSIADAVDAP